MTSDQKLRWDEAVLMAIAIAVCVGIVAIGACR